MRLEVSDDNNKKINIPIAGDQDYDYQKLNTLKDLDILVACHHGGKYCWSKKERCQMLGIKIPLSYTVVEIGIHTDTQQKHLII